MQSPAARFDAVVLTYPGSATPAAGPVSLTLAPGSRTLLAGASGTGKSSLLLALTGLIPASVPATVTGRVSLYGEPSGARPPALWSPRVAILFQDVEQTLVGMRVDDEVAFALENAGCDPILIEARIEAGLAAMDLPIDWRSRRTAHLSGGERQLVALAAIAAQEPDLLLADEPTAHLAPDAVARLRRFLRTRSGMTALIVEHRLDALLPDMDRLVLLARDGSVAADGPPADILARHGDDLRRWGIRPPASLPGEPSPAPSTPLVRLDSVVCGHERGRPVLSGLDLALHAGEITGFLGRNGAGKSTLAATLAGILPPLSGARTGERGIVTFQNPELQLLAPSVREELAAWLPAGAAPDRIDAALTHWRLQDLADRHPYRLSHGQKRRLVLACATLSQAPVVLLDEPSSGLDADGVADLVASVEALAGEGRAIGLVTHDLPLAARLCHRLVVIGEGRMLADGPAAAILADSALMRRAGLADGSMPEAPPC
jgi:energy-coupling factor transport system ATP-binding protein